MSERTILGTAFNELTSVRITAVVVDEAGSPLGSSALTTLKLTLYNLASGAIINSVNEVSILNAGRGTVDVSGNLVLTLLPADGVIVDDTLKFERHLALIEWTYAGGTKSGSKEIEFKVRNLVQVS